MESILIASILLALLIIYSTKMLTCYLGLFRWTPDANRKRYFVSIIVPARNEEDNIGNCLHSLIDQDYSTDLMEIVVVDDDSSDGTGKIVEKLIEQYPFIRMIKLGPCPIGLSPKKRALQAGIAISHGEIIFTTDADCWAQPKWISQMIRHFDHGVGMVIGYVGISKQSEQNLFHKLQALELIGLTMAGIGSLNAGDPIIANGANLAVRRTTFEQVSGYHGETHIISGDDDLLLQKIHRTTNWKIRACISSTAFVFTGPSNSIRDFIHQRTRWASKSLVYRKPPLLIFLAGTYLLYLWLFISLPLALAISSPLPIVPWLIKLAVDLVFILKSTALVGRTDLRKYFLLAELLQIPYILYVGLAGPLKKFKWKGR